MPLDHTATSTDLQLHAMNRLHRTEDERSEDEIPPCPIVPHHPSARKLVIRQSKVPTGDEAKATMTAKPHGNRFGKLKWGRK